MDIFCSTIQFTSWRQGFRARTEEVEYGAGEPEVFAVEQTPLFNSREYGNYLRSPQIYCLWHLNVVERVMRYWLKRVSFNFILALVCYDATGDLKSGHPGWTKQKPNVARLPQDERVFRPGSWTSCLGLCFI